MFSCCKAFIHINPTQVILNPNVITFQSWHLDASICHLHYWWWLSLLNKTTWIMKPTNVWGRDGVETGAVCFKHRQLFLFITVVYSMGCWCLRLCALNYIISWKIKELKGQWEKRHGLIWDSVLIVLRDLWKTIKTLSQDSYHFRWNSNQSPP